MLVTSSMFSTPPDRIVSRDGRIRAIRRPRSNGRRRDSTFLSKIDLFGKVVYLFDPTDRILSRDGRIRAIRRPRSNARSRDSKFLKSQRGCYIFQILLYFPNIPKVKTVVFLVKYQNPRGQDPSNPLRNTLVCRHFLISFLKSSHKKIVFFFVGICAQTAHF